MNTHNKFARFVSILGAVLILCTSHAQVPTAPTVVAKPDTAWVKAYSRGAYSQAMKDYAFSKDMVLKSSGDHITLGQYFGQDKPSSQLTLHKSFESETASKKTSFLVDEASNFVSFTVDGECQQGEIRVLIRKPTGDVLQEVVIEPSAGISWSQSFQLGGSPAIYFSSPDKKFTIVTDKGTVVADKEKDKEVEVKVPEKNKSLIGNWQIEINAKNAKGYYSLKIYAR